MREKLTAAILIAASVISLAACTPAKSADTGNSGTEAEKETVESSRSYSEEKVLESIDGIAAALAACDFEDLSKRCVSTPYGIRDLMPVIEEEEEDGDIYNVTDKMLTIRNMIAGTITCEADETSFKSNIFEKKYTVDVKFSIKDYTKVLGMREKFLGPADFNTLMIEEESTIDKIITLEFVKKDKHYLLANPEDLAELYSYDLPELEFMRNHFDMIESSYMTGPGWDPYTESYYDTNTFEFVVVLDTNARNYIWQYLYLISEETEPEWNRIYLSETVVDRYPTEIHLTYTQDENFSSGFYCFIIYDIQSGDYYGWEFDVYNSAETVPSVSTVTGEIPGING